MSRAQRDSWLLVSSAALLALLTVADSTGQNIGPRSFPPEIIYPSHHHPPFHRASGPSGQVQPRQLVRDVLFIDPIHYSLDLENDRVRALRVRLGPRDTVPMHDSRAAVLVCLGECAVRFTRPDGTMRDVHLDSGQTRWLEPDRRSETNLSAHSIEMLLIESKRDPLR